MGGALLGGVPALLARPAGFSIRKALGDSENNLYKNNYLSWTNYCLIKLVENLFLDLMVFFKVLFV